MGLFSNIETLWNKTESAVDDAVQEAEQVVIKDAKSIYEQAHKDALAANEEVTRIKGMLQDALVKSRDLHQVAIDAAQEASNAAEIEFNKFKQAIVAHTVDFNTQSSQLPN